MASSNVSAVTNHFPTANEGFTTTTSGSILAGAVTVPLNGVSGLTNGTVFVGIIEPGQVKEQTFTGIVDTAGTQITGVKWTRGSNVDHSAGVTVVDYVSGTGNNMFTKGILIEHNQDGTHDEALITSRTEDTSPDPDADFVLTYDTSATALKKAKISNLNGSATGWINDSLPAVSSVTNNGNGSETITFASTVASTLSPGMRLKTTRTVTAQAQCADLESGSTQYGTKGTPSGVASFTDDFTVIGWVKPESYATMVILGRADAGDNNGWYTYIDSTGRVVILGRNTAAANYRSWTSYQSVPLGKWTHIAAQLDMSGYTSATCKIYFNGIEVPGFGTSAGTNPTALTQPAAATAIQLGATNGNLFDGKICQVGLFSALLSAATIRQYATYKLAGSESTCIGYWALDGGFTDASSNANNLTAQGGAVATNADSPFGQDGSGTPSGTTDYALVMKVSTTDATVQVPEGCTIPTSGGVSAVSYSTTANPYGWVADKNRWRVSSIFRVQTTTTSNAGTFGNFASAGWALTVPIGAWSEHGYSFGTYGSDTTPVTWSISPTSLVGVAIGSEDIRYTTRTQSSAAATYFTKAYVSNSLAISAAQTWVLYTMGATTGHGIDGDNQLAEIFAVPSGI